MLFMPGRELGELVVAEVGLARAGGDDQRVVRRHRLAAEDVGGHGLGLEVDVGDLAEQHRGVLLPGQHLAGGRRDLALGEDAGRHLVEQRLEEVVGGLGDHRHVDVGALERLGAEQPAEAGADHHDLVPAARRRRWSAPAPRSPRRCPCRLGHRLITPRGHCRPSRSPRLVRAPTGVTTAGHARIHDSVWCRTPRISRRYSGPDNGKRGRTRTCSEVWSAPDRVDASSTLADTHNQLETPCRSTGLPSPWVRAPAACRTRAAGWPSCARRSAVPSSSSAPSWASPSWSPTRCCTASRRSRSGCAAPPSTRGSRSATPRSRRRSCPSDPLDRPETDDLLLTFGRGLSIVARCSDAWGAEIEDDGKVVWFAPAADFADGDGRPGRDHRRRPPPRPASADPRPGPGAHPRRAAGPLRRLPAPLPRAAPRGAAARAGPRVRLPAGQEPLRPVRLARPPAARRHRRRADRGRAGRRGWSRPTWSCTCRGPRPRTLSRFVELLDLADEFCREERLLSLARSAEQRKFQVWFLGEFVRQADGEPPLSWLEARVQRPRQASPPGPSLPRVTFLAVALGGAIGAAAALVARRGRPRRHRASRGRRSRSTSPARAAARRCCRRSPSSGAARRSRPGSGPALLGGYTTLSAYAEQTRALLADGQRRRPRRPTSLGTLAACLVAVARGQPALPAGGAATSSRPRAATSDRAAGRRWAPRVGAPLRFALASAARRRAVPDRAPCWSTSPARSCSGCSAGPRSPATRWPCSAPASAAASRPTRRSPCRPTGSGAPAARRTPRDHRRVALAACALGFVARLRRSRARAAGGRRCRSGGRSRGRR